MDDTIIEFLQPMVDDFDKWYDDIQRHRSFCDDKVCVFHPDNALFNNLRNVKPDNLKDLHFSKYTLSE